ncbi:MAG: helix-hairpin-helix domain-containing protein, partial [Bacillota bacterium]
IRKKIRELTFEKGCITGEVRDENLDEANKYEMYYEYEESISDIPPHRILALNRGEDEEILRIKVNIAEDKIYAIIKNKVIKKSSIFYGEIIDAIKDAYKRLIAPSIEREVRNYLTEKAEAQAIEVFGRNLRSLLLQSPLKDSIVMGIDPGYRTGSKVCVIDKRGEVLATETIYPHPPQNHKKEAERVLSNLIQAHGVDAIAIGNGTASRDTELFISELINEFEELKYTIVNEAGASVYSASKIGREEFPDMDVAMRGAVSIARRLQDPLAELVKINPAHIGVGLYQHDIDNNKLQESLEKVIESVVNFVGVDLNTASAYLLEYVSGINSNVAQNIVEFRKDNAGFSAREELKEVYRLGPKTFIQSAGFLRISSKKDPLARTPIHPESYQETNELIHKLGYKTKDIINKNKLEKLRKDLSGIKVREISEELKLGVPTLQDIIKALKEPGRDPRKNLNKPVFRSDVLKMDDLESGMILDGKVRNVVDFGAFVDIGIKEDGLVHISELSHDYIEDPLDLVQVGETVKVKVLEVDTRRKRVALSMKI